MSSIEDSAYEIRPFVGLGTIRFGQRRDEVLGLLGAPSRTFKKVPFATTETDAFKMGLHVDYDAEYRVESIDVVSPATVSFDGVFLLGSTVETALAAMAERGYNAEALTFNDAGIALYEDEGIVTCVTVFPRGYFDLTDPNSPISRAKAAAKAWRRR